MPGPSDSLVNLIEERRRDAAPHAVGPAHDAGDSGAGWRFIAAAVGLSLAATAAPTAIVMLAVTSPALGSPLTAGAMVALLLLAPAAVFLTSGLKGAPWIGRQAALAGPEAEFALLRIGVYTLLILYAVAAAPGECLPAAAAAVFAAWAMLAGILQWPAAPMLRRHGTIVLDVALFSTFLHFGGGAVAGWYPLYLLLIFAAGLRFGPEALIVAAIAAAGGFAAVALSTAFWRDQPALAGGLLFALAVVPACLAGTLHALARARARAQGAEAERQTTLRLIADTLGGAGLGDGGERQPSPIGAVGDYAALAAGTFVPPVETFELRRLLKRALMPLRARAADTGIALDWRVDARVPNRLRGRAQAILRIVAGLAEHALNSPSTTTVRLAVDAAALDPHRLRLTLRLDGFAAGPDRRRDTDRGAISLRLVERLIGLAEGAFAVDRLAPGRLAITVTLPLTIEAEPPMGGLDLGRRAVLIVTEDDELASQLAEPLAVWNAEALWQRDGEAALAELARIAGVGNRAVLIVDARDKLLSAFSLIHRAATIGGEPPLVVLIAPPAQIANLSEVNETGLDALLPVPVTEILLAHALDALPLDATPVRAVTATDQALGRHSIAAPPNEPDDRVTPIAAHPKFASEAVPVLDAKVIENLRSLSGDPEFLADLIETFRADSRQLIRRLGDAAAAADAAAFTRGLVALQRAATQLGGTQLCELLASLPETDPAELRQRGTGQIGRISAEVERLIAALRDGQPDRARQG